MKSLLIFLAGASAIGAGVYLLAGYILNAPAVSLRLVVVAGTILLMATIVFGVWCWVTLTRD